jgi:hypothetical protein
MTTRNECISHGQLRMSVVGSWSVSSFVDPGIVAKQKRAKANLQESEPVNNELPHIQYACFYKYSFFI